jgi:hypothetical protein
VISPLPCLIGWPDAHQARAHVQLERESEARLANIRHHAQRAHEPGTFAGVSLLTGQPERAALTGSSQRELTINRLSGKLGVRYLDQQMQIMADLIGL